MPQFCAGAATTMEAASASAWLPPRWASASVSPSESPWASGSRRSGSSGGTELSDTTIWVAIAVVTHDGQLTLSASATLIGMIVSVWPTTSTSWNETATVVQALQLASAYAELVSSTASPPSTVTSEYATSYLMPPSVVLTASAWESCGPGAFGSLNGNAVAGATGVALALPAA